MEAMQLEKVLTYPKFPYNYRRKAENFALLLCSAQLCCNVSIWMRSSVFCKLATLLYMGEC